MKKNLVIVTGLSGAGISSALKNFEDIGYEVFDNFPLSFLDTLLEESAEKEPQIAVGIDARTRGFSVEDMCRKRETLDATLLFLTADETVLQNRFSETRRRHPLAKDRPASAGIKKEQEWLHTLRKNADLLIDTSEMSIHDLRRRISQTFKQEKSQPLTITLMSFGFKYNIPREADIVMDVRFLKNPYWEQHLRFFTGQDEVIQEYIDEDEMFTPFIENFKNLILPLIPRYAHEGKSYLTIAIGCTGGKHRSVYCVETLAPWLENQGHLTHIMHRDVER